MAMGTNFFVFFYVNNKLLKCKSNFRVNPSVKSRHFYFVIWGFGRTNLELRTRVQWWQNADWCFYISDWSSHDVWWGVRLPHQIPSAGRFWRGKNELPLSIHRLQVQFQVHHYSGNRLSRKTSGKFNRCRQTNFAFVLKFLSFQRLVNPSRAQLCTLQYFPLFSVY